MEQLGRRAIEQEPQELSLPRCIRAAEQHKPVSCIRYRIERHGFGEGRLPIPGISIRDKVRGKNLQSPSASWHVSARAVCPCLVPCRLLQDASSRDDDSSKQQPQHHADWDSPGNKSSARKSRKLLRPSQQHAQQQVGCLAVVQHSSQLHTIVAHMQHALSASSEQCLCHRG